MGDDKTDHELIAVLQGELSSLMTGYREAINFIEGRRYVEFHGADWKEPTYSDEEEWKPPPGTLGWVFLKAIMPLLRGVLIRIFVKPFVEAHIRARAQALLRHLRVQGVDSSGTVVQTYITRLDGLTQVVTGWSQMRTSAIVLASLLSPILGVVVSRLADTDPSSLRSLFASMGTYKPVFILLGLNVALYFVVIQFGFRWKRVIFLGGREGSESESIFFDKIAVWRGFPTTNIYKTEDRVFKALNLRKPTEFPLDLAVFPGIYFFLGLTAWAWLFFASKMPTRDWISLVYVALLPTIYTVMILAWAFWRFRVRTG